jgi:hypothetical protein
LDQAAGALKNKWGENSSQPLYIKDLN